ncbi:hypothetical protein BMS3Bbin04_00906 [bacterium BMS3Bbin04]|nr:hypothetical protein BMS3Bbin04_00906 [bacterium BMS3Bbin04]
MRGFGWFHHRVQNPINAVPDQNIVFLGLNMNISCTLFHRFADDHVHQLDDRSVFLSLGISHVDQAFFAFIRLSEEMQVANDLFRLSLLANTDIQLINSMTDPLRGCHTYFDRYIIRCNLLQVINCDDIIRVLHCDPNHVFFADSSDQRVFKRKLFGDHPDNIFLGLQQLLVVEEAVIVLPCESGIHILFRRKAKRYQHFAYLKVFLRGFLQCFLELFLAYQTCFDEHLANLLAYAESCFHQPFLLRK